MAVAESDPELQDRLLVAANSAQVEPKRLANECSASADPVETAQCKF
jgi:hypothetical protein